MSHLEFLPSTSDWATGFPVPFSDAPTGDIAEPTELIQAETLENVTATCVDLLTMDEVNKLNHIIVSLYMFEIIAILIKSVTLTYSFKKTLKN